MIFSDMSSKPNASLHLEMNKGHFARFRFLYGNIDKETIQEVDYVGVSNFGFKYEGETHLKSKEIIRQLYTETTHPELFL